MIKPLQEYVFKPNELDDKTKDLEERISKLEKKMEEL